MLPPVWSGVQVQVTRPSSVSSDVCPAPPIRLLATGSSPTSMVKKVSCMDILFPDIHMLMLITPWSWAPATEDIQAQTSSRLASAPGWAGAGVVVVDIPDTRAALRASSIKDMVMVESV